MTTRTSCPRRARYFGSEPTTSPSPPSLAKGAASDAAKRRESLSEGGFTGAPGLDSIPPPSRGRRGDGPYLFRYVLPVFQEFLDPGIGQGVLGQLDHDRKGDGGNIGADQGRVEHVDRIAYAGNDDFTGVTVVVEDGADLFDDAHAVLGDIVQSSDKGGDVGGAGFGRQQRLHGGEDQGYVGFDFQGGQRIGGLEPFRRHGKLDNDVLVDLGQLLAFLDHAGRIQRNDLGRDRTVDDGNNL